MTPEIPFGYRSYATAALTGILSNAWIGERFGLTVENVAKDAFNYADAMLAEELKRIK